MRRMRRLAWAAVLGASLVQASDSMEEPTADVKRAAEAGNRFAVRLYDAVKRPGENGAVGPMCVSNGLTLLAAGAAGETRGEMVKVLGWDGDGRDVSNEWGQLMRTVKRSAGGVDLRAATALWVRDGVRVRPTFVRTARDTFSAEVGSWDPRDPAAAAAQINAWAERNTAGRIKEIVDAGAVAGGEVVVGSTTYFKGKWRRPFKEADTVEEAFHVDGKRSVRAKMMHRSFGNARYAESDSYQVLWLPYVEWSTSMVVVLPKQVDGLEAVEREIVAGGVGSLAKPTDDEVIAAVSLPRFTVRGRYALSGVLGRMGMGRAFGAGADFSGMVADPVRVTSVVHEAVVEVNEEGTEAAAGTGFAVGALADDVPRRVEFKADHPFLFMIVHERTGAVLFMGRVVDPSSVS